MLSVLSREIMLRAAITCAGCRVPGATSIIFRSGSGTEDVA